MNFSKKVQQNVWVTTLGWFLLFGVLIYGLMVFWGGYEKFARLIAQMQPGVLVGLLCVVTLGYLFRFLRWHIYLKILDFNVPLFASLRIFLASFLMAISPAKVGEAMKSYFLKKEFDIPVTPTMAAFFSERFTDVMAMVLLSGTGFLVYPHGGIVVLMIGGVQVGILVILRKKSWAEAILFQPLEAVTVLKNRIQQMRVFYRSSGELLSFKNLLMGTVLGIFAWGLEGLCLYFIINEFAGGIIVPPGIALFAFASAVLLGSVSMLPGGVGGSEAIMVVILIYFGVECPIAVSSTILVRVLTLWFGVACGTVFWLLTLRKLSRQE